MTENDRSCLSNWFPRLLAANIPVPRTTIIDAGEDWHFLAGVVDETDNEQSLILFRKVCGQIAEAATQIGFPCFLRTGQGSGKHQWKNTCYLADAASIPNHVAALIEWSEMVDMLGLPYRFWCVREMLPVEPVAILDAYGDMPLVPEVRYFVEDGEICCKHYYWPAGAVAEGFRCEPADFAYILLRSRCFDIDQPIRATDELARRVAVSFKGDGAWSVDILQTKRGFYVTDMADAGRSFHWPGCHNQKRFQGNQLTLKE